MNPEIKQLIDYLWSLAKEIVAEDSGHHPIAFLLGADYGVLGVVSIQRGADESPADVLCLLIQRVRPFGFVFISEAWDRARTADGAESKCEAVTLQAVTREVKALCKINFSRGENNSVVLWPDTEVITDDSIPGVELNGRIAQLREFLEVRQ